MNIVSRIQGLNCEAVRYGNDSFSISSNSSYKILDSNRKFFTFSSYSMIKKPNTKIPFYFANFFQQEFELMYSMFPISSSRSVMELITLQVFHMRLAF